MSGPPRDWDKELAEIDKVMAKQQGTVGREQGAGPSPPPPPALRSSAPARAPEARPVAAGRARLTGWLRVLLGVAVAGAVTLYWPYKHACGLALYGYLAALAGVVIVGLWGVVHSWRRRLGFAHLVALLVSLWAGVLLGKAILDRTGYPRHPATWKCGP